MNTAININLVMNIISPATPHAFIDRYAAKTAASYSHGAIVAQEARVTKHPRQPASEGLASQRL